MFSIHRLYIKDGHRHNNATHQLRASESGHDETTHWEVGNFHWCVASPAVLSFFATAVDPAECVYAYIIQNDWDWKSISKVFIIVTDFRLLLKPDRFCLLLAVRRNTVLLWLDFLKLYLIQFIVRLHIFTLKSRECKTSGLKAETVSVM